MSQRLFNENEKEHVSLILPLQQQKEKEKSSTPSKLLRVGNDTKIQLYENYRFMPKK